MRKRFENKHWRGAFAFFALISLVLLAGALKGLDFRPAQPIGGGSNAQPAETLPSIGETLPDIEAIPFEQQLVLWMLMLLVVALVASFLNPNLRKKLLYNLLRVVMFMVALFYILKSNPNFLSDLFRQFPSAEDLTPASQTSAAPVFHPPQIPNWLTYVAALGFTLLVVLFLWWLNRLWKQIRALTSTHQPLDQIARIARASLKDLEIGRNSEDAIIKCYERMGAVVGSKQGLHRGNAMTPSEFASRLERSGLPREAVLRLTHLFESVRYGGHLSGSRETAEAISCLTSILQYCGESS